MKDRLIYLTIALLLTSFSYHAEAQKLDPLNLEMARKYEPLLKDEKMMITRSELEFEFFRSEASGDIQIRSLEYQQYLSLQARAGYVKKQFYDDNSEIVSYSVENRKNKRLDHTKYCGHVKSDEIFYSDAKVCAYDLKLTLPGQVINFESEMIYHDPRYLTKIFLQDDLFMKEMTLSFYIPFWLDVELKEVNFDGYEINKEISKTSEGQWITFSMKDVDALPSDDNMPGYLHFVPHILVLTKSQFENGSRRNILSNTTDLYTWYETLISDMQDDRTKLEGLVAEILGDNELSDKEQIELLYYWVQDNIRYIAFEDGIAGFKPENAQDVLNKKYGDCKGMANLLKNMLIIAGYDARLTWVGTDRIPYDYSIPSLAVDNHMVCSVIQGDSVTVLDATEDFQSIGSSGKRIRGRQILIEDNDGYMIKTIDSDIPQRNSEKHELTLTIDGDRLAGQGVLTLTGERMKQVKSFSDAIKSDKVDKFLSYLVNNGKTNEYEIISRSEFDRDQPFEIRFALNLTNKVQSYNDEIYIDLDTSKDYYNAIIKEDRESPLDLGPKSVVNMEIRLSLPENTGVKSLPEALSLENGLMSARLAYKEKDGQVIYSKSITILKNIVTKEEFDTWNESVKKLKKFYNDQLVIEKKDK